MELKKTKYRETEQNKCVEFLTAFDFQWADLCVHRK